MNDEDFIEACKAQDTGRSGVTKDTSATSSQDLGSEPEQPMLLDLRDQYVDRRSDVEDIGTLEDGDELSLRDGQHFGSTPDECIPPSTEEIRKVPRQEADVEQEEPQKGHGGKEPISTLDYIVKNVAKRYVQEHGGSASKLFVPRIMTRIEAVPWDSPPAAVAAMATIVGAHGSKEVASYIHSLLSQMRHTRDELGEAVTTMKAVNKFLSRATVDAPASRPGELKQLELEAEERKTMQVLRALHDGMPEAMGSYTEPDLTANADEAPEAYSSPSNSRRSSTNSLPEGPSSSGLEMNDLQRLSQGSTALDMDPSHTGSRISTAPETDRLQRASSRSVVPEATPLPPSSNGSATKMDFPGPEEQGIEMPAPREFPVLNETLAIGKGLGIRRGRFPMPLDTSMPSPVSITDDEDSDILSECDSKDSSGESMVFGELMSETSNSNSQSPLGARLEALETLVSQIQRSPESRHEHHHRSILKLQNDQTPPAQEAVSQGVPPSDTPTAAKGERLRKWEWPLSTSKGTAMVGGKISDQRYLNGTVMFSLPPPVYSTRGTYEGNLDRTAVPKTHRLRGYSDVLQRAWSVLDDDEERRRVKSAPPVFVWDRGHQGGRTDSETERVWTVSQPRQTGDGISHRAESAVVKQARRALVVEKGAKRHASASSRGDDSEKRVPTAKTEDGVQSSTKETIHPTERFRRPAAQIQQRMEREKLQEQEPAAKRKKRKPTPLNLFGARKRARWPQSSAVLGHWQKSHPHSPEARPKTVIFYPSAPLLSKFKSILSPESSPEPIPSHLRTHYYFDDSQPPSLEPSPAWSASADSSPTEIQTSGILTPIVPILTATAENPHVNLPLVGISPPPNTQQILKSPIRTSPKAVRFDVNRKAMDEQVWHAVARTESTVQILSTSPDGGIRTAGRAVSQVESPTRTGKQLSYVAAKSEEQLWSRLLEAERKVEETNAALQGAKTTLQDRDDTIHDLKYRNDILVKAVESLRNEGIDSQESFDLELEICKSKLKEERRRSEGFDASAQRTNRLVDKLEAEGLERDGELDAERTANKSLRGEMFSLKKQIAENQNDLLLKGKTMAELERDLSAAEQRETDLQEEVQRLTLSLSQKSATVDSLNEFLEDVQAQAAERDAEFLKVRQELERDLADSNRQYSHDVERLQDELDETHSKHEQMLKWFVTVGVSPTSEMRADLSPDTVQSAPDALASREDEQSTATSPRRNEKTLAEELEAEKQEASDESDGEEHEQASVLPLPESAQENSTPKRAWKGITHNWIASVVFEGAEGSETGPSVSSADGKPGTVERKAQESPKPPERERSSMALPSSQQQDIDRCSPLTLVDPLDSLKTPLPKTPPSRRARNERETVPSATPAIGGVSPAPLPPPRFGFRDGSSPYRSEMRSGSALRRRTVRVGDEDPPFEPRGPDARPFYADPGSGGGSGRDPGGPFNRNTIENHQPINIILGTTPTRLVRPAAELDVLPTTPQLKLLTTKPAGSTWHKKVLLWAVSLPILLLGLLLLLEILEDLLQPSYGAFGWGGPEVDNTFTRLATRAVLLWTGVVGTREILT